MEKKKETIKNKIAKIEGLYVRAVLNMDNANEKASEAGQKAIQAENEQQYHEAEYQRHKATEQRTEAKAFASESIALAEALAILRGWSFDDICQDLHERFNLWHR